MARNVMWTLDLTYLEQREGGEQRPVLGLLDHGTRICLALRDQRSKASIQILRALLEAVERFGCPRVLRTDNEPVFTSLLFRLGLAVLGIRHQRTARFAPWQNGRIERLFGTFKELARGHCFSEQVEERQCDLDLFRFWYNVVRPHQHLDFRTPAQAWTGRLPKPGRKPLFFSEWDGLLTGYYFPS